MCSQISSVLSLWEKKLLAILPIFVYVDAIFKIEDRTRLFQLKSAFENWSLVELKEM